MINGPPAIAGVKPAARSERALQPVSAFDQQPPLFNRRRYLRKLKRERAHFEKVRRAESWYASQLRKIARHVGDLINSYPIGDVSVLPLINDTLRRYASILEPWAAAVAARMIAQVTQRDATAWFKTSREIGQNLHQEIQQTPMGDLARRIQEEQVHLITSIPLDAAQRVQELTMDYATGGRRYADLVDMIRNTTGVTVSRATLIARTETAKAQSAIVQARSQTLGIEGYIWRTVMDIDVRPEHQRLEGTFHRWDDPPVAEASGERHHPGAFPNCFTEETVIDLRFGCRGLYRAFYDGPLVTLIIGSSVIEVTPNHPIRTISGWVPAGLLNKGDKVICIGKQAWEIGDDSIDNTKPSFINLFESLWPFCSSRKVFAGGNFYGDIVKNDVDHITFNPVLSGYLKAGFFQDITQFSFTKANSRIWDSSIISRQSHSFESTLPSRLNTIPVLLCGLVSRDELVSLKHCPSNDSISTEDIAYGSHRTLMPFSQGGSTYSTGIVGADTRFRQFLSAIQSTQTFTNTGIDTEGSQLDTELVGMTRDEFSSIFDSRPIAYQLCCVLDKSFRNFSGHVYTMETDTGYYAAGKSKILAKNCRCYAEPLLPEVRF